MADRALLLYRGGMDYTELQSFYGYDMDAAHKAAIKYRAAIEEEMCRVGLEAIHPESVREIRRGLRGEGDFRCPGADVVRGV